MHALIVADGEPPDAAALDATWPGWRDGIALIVAADGGAVAAHDAGLVVDLVVGDADGVVFEQGEAVKADGLWWTYTTTALRSTTAAARILATAQDLPGNNAEMALEN